MYHAGSTRVLLRLGGGGGSEPSFLLLLHFEVRAWDLLCSTKSSWGWFNWKKSLICG